MTNPNPTPMDIIMERGLSGEEALLVITGRWWEWYSESATSTAPYGPDLIGMALDEWEQWRGVPSEGPPADKVAIIDQIIQARRAKEEKADESFCGRCGEPWCDECAYRREKAVAENPCRACNGSGLSVSRPASEPDGPDLEAAESTATVWLDAMKTDSSCLNLARSYLQVLKELEGLRELHRPRKTSDGEWPEDDYLLWDDGWVPMDFDEGVPGTWLPAPPKPIESK